MPSDQGPATARADHAVIEASAPVRICDLGGWTDTWFGGPGRVVNVAVAPGVTVSVRRVPGAGSVILDAESYGDRYRVGPGSPGASRHPLLEGALRTYPLPADAAFEVRVSSAVPAGCGTGTSASVAVAMVGALAAARAEHMTPREVAYAAHRLEVDVLGAESGIQDQLCAAYGGISYVEVDRYPEATVETLPSWDVLGDVLTLVYLGRAHRSSDVHREVIEDAAHSGSEAFERLRAAASASRDAVMARDLVAFGASMIANTEAQEALHPSLVGADARQVIALAAGGGALGWKVNGAGGDGGSVTLLSSTIDGKAEMERRVAALDRRYRVLPVRVSDSGLVVRHLGG